MADTEEDAASSAKKSRNPRLRDAAIKGRDETKSRRRQRYNERRVPAPGQLLSQQGWGDIRGTAFHLQVFEGRLCEPEHGSRPVFE